ncbi:MAG: hypothetical protein H0X37_08700 [Herpetosiphonaceae bacterium]|nr:hypothetical protein [Herpetosiphonaceae bacterium]
MSTTTTHAITEQDCCEATRAAEAVPIACDLMALPVDQRQSHLAGATQLLTTTARETRELPNGYAFRFAADDYPTVTAFIADERRCCPFFTFVLEVAAERGPLWLSITGPDGVKDILRDVRDEG